MRKELQEELKRKGWTEEEISDTRNAIDRKEIEDKSRAMHHMDKLVFWISFLVIIFGNLIISIFLIPFLLVFDVIVLDILVIILALSFGSLFTLLIDSMRNLRKRHHIFAATIIPSSSVVLMFIIVNATNNIGEFIGFTTVREDPIMISILYAIAFVTPYLFYLIWKKRI